MSRFPSNFGPGRFEPVTSGDAVRISTAQPLGVLLICNFVSHCNHRIFLISPSQIEYRSIPTSFLVSQLRSDWVSKFQF